MTDLTVETFRPEPAQFAWTFGGVDPVRRVPARTFLERWTVYGGVHERLPDMGRAYLGERR